MKTFVPNYYKEFKCIADKCKHNCCIGWEIDIDEDTLLKYKNHTGKFSRKLKSGIDFNENHACFKLDGKGRCVFLNDKNLCEIILNLGEESICQICTDHPRFRNYFSNRIEIGLGLCCEEAGRIILSQEDDFSLEETHDDGFDFENTTEEDDFFKLRDNIIKSIKKNDDTILKFCNGTFPDKTVEQWAEKFLSLERLDDHWTIILNDLKSTDINNISLPNDFKRYFKNLLIYFLYRHLNEFFTDKDLMFIHLSCKMIENICKMHMAKYEKITFDDLVEYSRMYSSEIEYSDENIEKLLEIL